MKRMILIAMLIAAAPLYAQHGRVLTDNDDGRVEVWLRGDQVRARSAAHPIVEALFVGSGWDKAAKESLVSELRRTATIAGTRDLESAATLNDLQIQRLIEALPLADPNVIEVVFLGPGVQSTLGEHRAGVDYDAYHSHFHAHDTNIRYVVVPWSDVAAEAAAKTTALAK